MTDAAGNFEEFTKSLTDYFRMAQDRSLIATIEDWTKNSRIPSPAIFVDSESFFLHARWEKPEQAKFARFAAEVYACVDQLITTLILLSAEFYKASRRTKGQKQKQRCECVAEILKCLATHLHPSLESMTNNGELVFFAKDGLPRFKSTYPGDSIFSLHFAFANFREAVGSGKEIIHLVHRHLGSRKSNDSMRKEIVERFYMLIFLGPLLNYRRDKVNLGSSSLEDDMNPLAGKT